MPKKKRRRDGIYFRQWDQSWYSSVTGKQLPLRDEFGQKIKGREREPDAKKAYARLLLQPVDAAREVALDVADIALDYLRRIKHDRAASYIQRAKRYLESFVSYVGVEMQADQVTPAICEKWLQSTGWASNTRRSALLVVKAAFNSACKYAKTLASNPLTGLSPPAATSRTEVFTPEQLEQLWKHGHPNLVEICQFMLATGCRPGEACKLTAEHFQDGDPNAVFVLPPTMHKTGRKTGKYRHIPMNRELTRHYRGLVAARPSGPIFRNPRGRPWNTTRLAFHFSRLARKLGFPRQLTPHAFRHTFVTRHLDRGVPITRVAQWIGDTVTTVERTYWHAIHRANKHRFDGLDAIDSQSHFAPSPQIEADLR